MPGKLDLSIRWKWSDWRTQVFLVVALQTFAALVLGGSFAVLHRLSNDRLLDFSLFRDTLHALNAYGEVPWWNPSVQSGFPFYYFELLYFPGRLPLFSLIAGTVWVLGRAGIIIQSYFLIFILYFAFLIPVALNLSILALARQMIRHPLAIAFVIVAAVFSPGVIFSLTDVPMGLTPYAFFFAAAWVRFLRTRTRTSFLLVCLMAMVMACGSAYLELFWVVLFVPFFVLITIVGARGVANARMAVRSIPALWWAGASVAVIVCALPNLLAYRYGNDVMSVMSSDRGYYAVQNIRPGSPLEPLAASTPGMGFMWTDYISPAGRFRPAPMSRDWGYISYGYLGMLALSLAGIGLACGRRRWSGRLFACIAAGVTIIMLGGYSPFLSLVLVADSPLRAMNHFSDTTFRVGLYAIFVLAAGLGVEVVVRGRGATRRWILAGLFATNAIVSVVWLLFLFKGVSVESYVFGTVLALALLFVVALIRFAMADTRSRRRAAFVVLLVLTLVDTSTFAFAYRRISIPVSEGVVSEPDVRGVGTPAQGLIPHGPITKSLYLRGVTLSSTVADDEPDVHLTPVDTSKPWDQKYVIAIVAQTYNTLRVRVNTTQPAMLDWDDAFSEFWRAQVNGVQTPINRTPAGMKSLRVPAGESEIFFQFSPGLLPLSVLVSYLALILVAGLALREYLRAVPSSGLPA